MEGKELLIRDIEKLKKERDAVILSHNYQLPEIQDIADFVGDSLELARIAEKIQCRTIVFCGVTFMAETAYILSPEKTVLMPDPSAGCPLADMVNLEQLRKLQEQHPDAYTVCYVNSYADVKAEVDVCCTSANAVKIVLALNGQRDILFIPDRCLGDYIARKTGKKLHLARGFCPTHHRILKEDILRKKEEYPDAEVIVHPECTAEVIDLADYVCSTSQMVRRAKESAARRFIIGTEEGLLYKLKKENPDKEFHSPSNVCVCPNMKKTTLEKVLWSLESMETKIVIDEEIRKKAHRSLQRMLEYV
ncbi:MAG: quinolinate synthase NadA [bacterium]